LVIREKTVVGTPILGYASIMCVLLLGFGLVFIMLAILGEYIWRTLEESRNRPPFIIDTVKRHDSEE
jgi:dolichol-phosphate mannosyltransferase